MPQSWIKMHLDVLDNPKVMSLDPTDFRLWTLALLVARRINEDGVLPPLDKLAYTLHVHPKWLAAHIDTLVALNLVERRDDALVVHDWDDWQRGYPSEAPEAVAERVARSRANKRALNGVTSGNESGVVTSNVTSVTTIEEKRKEKKRKEEKPAIAGRGARIPDDFALTDAMVRYAASKGIGEERAREHVEEFALYWQAATRNATSADWVRRWQSRLLSDIRDGRLSPDIVRPSAPMPEPEPTPAETTYAELLAWQRGDVSPSDVTPETVAVVNVLGGWIEMRKSKPPPYPQWLGAWNRLHGSA